MVKMVKIELAIENKNSYQIPAKDDIEQTIFKVLKDQNLEGIFEIDIKIVDKNEIQKLNKKYRQVDAPTDVLSFPIQKKVESDIKTPILLGDIIICPEMAEADIIELIQHATLHLLGYHHKGD